MPEVSEDREELLRTQAIATILQAMGATQVNTWGNSHEADGVFLDSKDTVTARSHWSYTDARYEFTVRVNVSVSRQVVPHGS